MRNLLLCVLVACVTPAALAAPPTIVRFNIPEGTGRRALDEFARTSGVQVFFRDERVTGATTRAVVGDFSPAEALKQMLPGSEFSFKFVNEREVVITATARAGDVPQSTDEQIPQCAVNIDAYRGSDLPTNIFGVTVTKADLEMYEFRDADHLVQSTPQSIGNPSTAQFGGGSLLGKTNTGLGSVFNLRGLGTDSTVILVNGVRQAPGGSDAASTDVSGIPLSAIERVEILPGTGSIEYGADADGGVTNFITSGQYNGSDSEIRYGALRRGEPEGYEFSQSVGGVLGQGTGALWVESAHRNALPLNARAQARSDLRAWRGTNYDTYFSDTPNVLADGRLYGVTLGNIQFDPAKLNLQDLHEGTDIVPEQTRTNLAGTYSHPLGDSLNVSFDGRASRRETTASTSPFQALLTIPPQNPSFAAPEGSTGPIQAAYSFGSSLGPQVQQDREDNLSTAMRLSWKPAALWDALTTVSYSSARHDEVVSNQVNQTELNNALNTPVAEDSFNVFADGLPARPEILKRLRASSRTLTSSSFVAGDFSLSGQVWERGHLDITSLSRTDYRIQSFATDTESDSSVPAPYTNLHRDVAAFAQELRIRAQDVLFVHQFEVRLAGRFERYMRYGSGVAPRAEVIWSPASWLTLSCNRARTFRAPVLPALSESDNGAQIAVLPDPTSKTGTATTLVFYGSNRNLTMEKASSQVCGAVFGPMDLDAPTGARFSVDYFDVDARDRVEQIPFSTDALTNPAFGPNIVLRSSLDTVRADLCSRSQFFGALNGCLDTPISAIIDDRQHNTAVLETRGFDFSGSYAAQTRFGRWGLLLNGVFLTTFARSDAPGEPLNQVLNTPNNPLRLQAHAMTTWSYREWEAAVTANYSGSYRDTGFTPAHPVGAWTTFDVRVAWAPRGDMWEPLQGVALILTAENLFNRESPFVNNPLGIGIDLQNGSLLGRIVSIGFRKRWGGSVNDGVSILR